MHDELHAPELGLRIDQVEDPFESTFAWVFDIPSFGSWLQDPGSKLFWIHGKPGSGKSTLMKFIFESRRTWDLLHNWRADSLEVKAGFFFHHRGSALQKSFEGVLRSLVTQILAPYEGPYRKKHGPTLESYQQLRNAQDKLQRENQAIKDQLTSSLEVINNKISNIRARVNNKGTDNSFPAEDTHHNKEKLAKLLGQQINITQQLASIERDHESKLSSIKTSIQVLAARFQPHGDDPVANFLTKIVGGFLEGHGGVIPRLERALSQLLDQDVQKTDLVLFFDALDEFDGHLDLICRFLKGLVITPDSSLTSVKICFSSRPWQPLKEHFSVFPGFSLQDYTKSDMEEFAANSVTQARIGDPLVMRLVPEIITRANGVFLWVKLALKVLVETAATTPVATLPSVLETKLNELPEDLFEFYNLIISRISRSNRRKTFALLELLARRSGHQNTLIEIWSATIIASCSTGLQAEEELNRVCPGLFQLQETPPLIPLPAKHIGEQARKDIASWSGGLVEVKTHGKTDYPELMHQTVLELVTSLECKRIVLGDLAGFVYENGHSFYLKYLILCQAWEPSDFWSMITTRKAQYPIGNPLIKPGRHESQDVGLIAHHAEASELTTGMSHFDAIYDVCSSVFYNKRRERNWRKDDVFLCIAAACGLTLCLRDWLGKADDPFSISTDGPERGLPLLQGLVFRPPTKPFAERHLATIQLILEKGYSVNREPEFLTWLYGEDWETRSHHRRKVIPESTLLNLTRLVLEHGADPNIELPLFNSNGMKISTARPLHIAPSYLASELILHGANSYPINNRGATGLDWLLNPALDLLGYLPNLDSAERFERCLILAQAGGSLSLLASKWDVVEDMLREFEEQGYDTKSLSGLLRLHSPQMPTWAQETPHQVHPPGPALAPRTDTPQSGSVRDSKSQEGPHGACKPPDEVEEPNDHSTASSTRSRRTIRGLIESLFKPSSSPLPLPKLKRRFQR